MLPLLALHSALAGEPTGDTLKYCRDEWNQTEKVTEQLCEPTPGSKPAPSPTVLAQQAVGKQVVSALVKNCSGLTPLNPEGKASFGLYEAPQAQKDSLELTPEYRAPYMGVNFLVSASTFESANCGLDMTPVLSGFTSTPYAVCDDQSCYTVGRFLPISVEANYPEMGLKPSATDNFIQVNVKPRKKP